MPWLNPSNKSNDFSFNPKFAMDSLPTEILLDILERLDPGSLLELSVVSRKMHSLSRQLLFREFRDGYSSPERCLERLRSFHDQVLKAPSLALQIRLIRASNIREADMDDAQDILRSLLERIPNLQRLAVPGGQRVAGLLNDLIKDKDHFCRLQALESPGPSWERPSVSTRYTSLECRSSIFGLKGLRSLSLGSCVDGDSYAGILSELQASGDLSLRHIHIRDSNLGYTILARLIQSCKRLESFDYNSPTGHSSEDSDPATVIQALSLHEDSLESLSFKFRPRGIGENFDQVPKIGSLRQFLRLKSLSVDQDCLPREPLFPPSLQDLSIEALHGHPLEPILFRNLAIASHSTLSSLSVIFVNRGCSIWPDRPVGIFDGFHERIRILI